MQDTISVGGGRWQAHMGSEGYRIGWRRTIADLYDMDSEGYLIGWWRTIADHLDMDSEGYIIDWSWTMADLYV